MTFSPEDICISSNSGKFSMSVQDLGLLKVSDRSWFFADRLLLVFFLQRYNTQVLKLIVMASTTIGSTLGKDSWGYEGINDMLAHLELKDEEIDDVIIGFTRYGSTSRRQGSWRLGS